MEPTSDSRFDPNYAAQILLELAHEQSLERLLQKLVERVMDRPHVACVQIWLIEKGDLCATCPHRTGCPDQSRCLHLAATKANSILEPGKGFGQFDPQTARLPLQVPPIGSVVVSGQMRDVANLEKLPVSRLDPEWMREEGIRAYSIDPIIYKGEPLGAIVAATRESAEAQLRAWGPIFANHIAAAIANARAFEEICLARKRLEQANQSLGRELAERERAQEALRRSNRELRAISSCNQVLLRATDEQSLLQEICRIVCEEAGYLMAWVGYAEQDEAKTVRPVASSGAEDGVLANLGITWADTDRGTGPCGTAIRTGKTLWVQDFATDPQVAPWKDIALPRGFRSAIALPLRDEQARTFGSLNIYSAQANAFASEEIRLLEELAGDLAFGISTMRSRAARQRAEQALRESEQKYHELVEHANGIILHWQRDGRIIHLNEFGQRFFGYTDAEIRGRHLIGTLVPETESRGRDLQKLMEEISANPSAFEQNVNENIRRSGERVWIAWTNKVVLNSSGEVTEILSIGVDITERKRTEEALRRSEAYLAEGQRLSHTGSWAWSPVTMEALYWSEEMFRIYGLDPRKGVPGADSFWQRIHPEDLEATRETLMKAAHRASDYEHHHRILLPDGTVKHIHAIGHPVLDEKGQLIEYVGTAMDVTERKGAEDELRKHREHLEDLVKQRTEQLALLNQLVYGSLESGEVAAWWIDFNEPDTYHALDNAARMLGIEPDPNGEKIYKLSEWSRLLSETATAYPDYASIIEQTKEGFAGAVSGKYKHYRAIYPVALPDGSVKWMDARAEITKRDERGQALFMTGTLIDVTKLKQAEADLAEAKSRAEAANREKSTFLANMSHELRTPLNAVLGFSRLLNRDPELVPRQKEALDIIVRSGEHLLNLINNVLDVAKIESGRVVLDESEIDLHQLLHEIQSLMGVGAVEKGLPFGLERAPDLPRFVGVDAGKLRQVLINLVGNAIKYTDSGGVKLRALGVGEDKSQKALVRFEVVDSGPGIKPEDCQRIFTPFVQLGIQAAAQAGTGLGLAICKQYVELMGGSIGVRSEPGKGSVFYFEIPVSVLPSVEEPEEAKRGRIVGLVQGQSRYKLLVVEDQPENRLLLRRLLDPLGFELREAANGREAVTLFEEWHPDLIWMDIRMPVMDGLEAVRRIRASEGGAFTKIVALTAHALEEERRPIMAVGCDDFVRKPFREQEIFDALARHLRLKFIYEQTPRQESPLDPSRNAVRPEQLDALPRELLHDLRQAVIELDTARTQALIERVTHCDASLGQALNTLARQLDYKRLLKLLDREYSKTEPNL